MWGLKKSEQTILHTVCAKFVTINGEVSADGEVKTRTTKKEIYE
jgi:ribosome-associated protein YbcJ (S4-like RNA binding protein)